MTVSTTTTPRVQYNGNGVTTVFNTSFTFDKSSDIVVILTSVSGIDTTKIITTHYTVSGGSGSSGSVTMITAPALGEKLTIYRSTSLTQNTDYQEASTFPAASHELALDRLTYMVQELDYDISRATLNSITSGITGITLPSPVALQFLRWNSSATNLENTTISNIGSYIFGSGTGLLVQSVSGSESIVRSIVGTSNQITVTNGNGIAGNPTLSLASSLNLTDDQLTIQDDVDTTKTLKFDCSGISTGTQRVLAIPNATGTIALNDPQFVTLATSPTLQNERVLTAGSGISLTDAGAGSTVTIANTGVTGQILQVVSVTKTDTASYTSTGSYGNITGLSATITPSSTSSRILVLVDMAIGHSASSVTASFRLYDNTATTDILLGDTAGSRLRDSVGFFGGTATGSTLPVSMSFVHSPGSVAARTYTVRWLLMSAGTLYINRSGTDTDAATHTRSASTITLMEIKG